VRRVVAADAPATCSRAEGGSRDAPRWTVPKDAKEVVWVSEAEWQAAADWGRMLNQVRARAGTRKLLLLAVALCRRIWDRFPYDDCRRAVEAVERLADHPRVDEEDYAIAAEADAAMERLQEGYGRVHEADPGPRGAYLAATACGGMWHDPDGMIEGVAGAAAIAATGAAEGPAWEAERHAQAGLLREVFGNPFRPVAADRSWRTPDVVGLARAIYEDRAFDRLPILADALQDAGCADEDVLGHCRSGGPHVRGCWVVDLLLRKG
jgi:hypothetical protein